MKRISIAVLVLSLSVTHVHATGIPVVDVVSNTQRMVEFIKTLEKWRQEYVYWADQLARAQRLHDSFNGVRNLGDLLDRPELWRYMPNEFASLYRSMKREGYEGLIGNGGVIWALNRVAERCEDIALRDVRLDCQTKAVKPSQDSSVAEAQYNATMERAMQIRDLQREINRTKDPKAIAELQARISIEQASIANETNRMLAVNAAAEAEDRVMEQRQREFNTRAFSAEKGVDLTPLEF